ncbi:IPTL-CTERM sorting domain-containing protein [Paracidovorax avenae]|uniref:IPTL-CTERM sorting domain-containing protein n=1 Tax=Paracidovorax avenae TaxID=80867 RepID=UPI001F3F475D|nr:IPTL-CTERM sorting domain-containing protein [Paracidovorax avenae]
MSAQTLGMYLSAPRQQDTTRTGATVERFLSAGAIGASGTWAIGDYTATSGNRAAASQYGGAGGTGQFLSVGAGTISVTLTGNRQYVGFWWSAGDATNIIRFYDTDNNLLAEFTTASLVNLLQGPGNITALDGQQYAKAAYYGNPNPDFAGMNDREPYGYVNLLLQGTSVRFGRIEIRGANFELDNIAIADPVPVDTSWVDYGSQPVALPPGAVGASNDTSATRMGTPVSGNAAANDTAPAGARWTKTSDPANGSVVMNDDGTYTYTPAPGFTGVDSFDYTVCKPAPDTDQCANATVRITVGLDAVDDRASTAPNTPVNSSVPNNDVFPQGATFTVSSSPTRGTVTMDPATGDYTYTPNPNVTGTDTFQYRLCLPAPNATQCDTATVTITVDPNTAPVATAVTIGGAPQQGVPLTGTYTYGDAQNDAESVSTFRWVRSASGTSPAGGFTVGTGNTYTPTAPDAGQFLFFCVTPQAQTGTTPGAEVCTAASATAGGPAAPVAAPSAVAAIPTLSEWGMVVMSSLLALFAIGTIRRRG